jgi:hypothetical protein
MPLTPTYRGAYDAFNPSIGDTQDPNWLNAPQRQGPVNFVSGSAIATKAAGNILAGAIKGADEIVEDFAKNTASNAARQHLSNWTAGLEIAQNAINPVGAATAQPVQRVDTNGNPIGPTDSTKLPPQIQDLPDKLGVLNAAKMQKKIPEELFWGMANKLASETMSQFPNAYRDVIENTFAKELGGHPATKYAQALLSNLTSVANAKDEERKGLIALGNKAADQGDTLAAAKLQDYLDGRTTAQQFRQYIAESNADHWTLEKLQHKLTSETLVRGDIERNLLEQANISFSKTASNYFDYLANKDLPGTKRDENGNIILPDPKAVNRAGEALKEMRNRAEDQFNQWLDEPLTTRDPNTGKSVPIKDAQGNDIGTRRQHMDPGKVAQLMTTHLSKFERAEKDLFTGESSSFNAINRESKAVEDGTLKFLYDLPGYGNAFAIANVMDSKNKIWANKWYSENKGELSPIENTGNKAIRSWILTTKRPEDAASLGTAIGAANKGGLTSGNFNYSVVQGAVKDFTAPDTPADAKQSMGFSIVKALNEGFIGSINPGKTNTQQWRTFADLTDPKVVAEMYKDPKLWTQYRNGVELSFGKDLMSKELLSLHDLGDQPGLGISWDNQAHAWHLLIRNEKGVITNWHGEDTQALPERRTHAGAYTAGNYTIESAQKIVNKVNAGLMQLKNIPAVDKDMDINSYLIRTMYGLGVDFSNIVNPQTLPEKMLSATIIANQEKPAGSEEKKKSQDKLPWEAR